MSLTPPTDTAAATSAQPQMLAELQASLRALDALLRAVGGEVAVQPLDELCRGLVELAARSGVIGIEVRPRSLTCDDVEVFREGAGEDGFVSRLHRDGLRRLVLHAGLTRDEAARFVQALAAVPKTRRPDRDAVALLWEADLEKIERVVADLSDDEAVDRSGYKEREGAILAAARSATLPAVSASDRRARELPELDPGRIAEALNMAGESPWALEEPAETAELRERYERDPRRPAKLAEILARALSRAKDDAAPALLATFERLVAMLLASKRLEALHELLCRIDRLREAGVVDAKDLERMVGCLAQEERISALVQRLQEDAAEAALDLLRMITADGAATMIRSAARLTSERAQQLVLDVVAEAIAERPELVKPLLEAPEAAIADLAHRALIAVGTEEALEELAPLQHHPSPTIRIALLRSTFESTSTWVRSARLFLRQDGNSRVRAEAERSLALHRDPELAELLHERLKSEELRGSSFVEKRRVCELLGSYGGKREIETLVELLGLSTAISRRYTKELGAAAAYGLAVAGDRDLAELLEVVAARRLTPRIVKDACRAALAKLRAAERACERAPEPAPSVDPSARALETRDLAVIYQAVDSEQVESPAEAATTGRAGAETEEASGETETDRASAETVELEAISLEPEGVDDLLRGYLDTAADEREHEQENVVKKPASASAELLLKDYVTEMEQQGESGEDADESLQDLLRGYLEDE